MITMPLDMTSELAAIPNGLAIALIVSLFGILIRMSPEEIQVPKRWLVATYHRTRAALRPRHIRVVPGLTTTSGAR